VIGVEVSISSPCGRKWIVVKLVFEKIKAFIEYRHRIVESAAFEIG
jgi:hypothetical protein